MAKYLHKIFEMFDFREEAIQTLTPKVRTDDNDDTPPGSWTFKVLNVSRTDGVTHAQFKEVTTFDDSTMTTCREDFAQFAQNLGRDSKVVLDFTGVESLHPGFIEMLILFNKRLKIKGSRVALCCLAPLAKESFFAPVRMT
jgi:anti-anti-sigma regulatory factor